MVRQSKPVGIIQHEAIVPPGSISQNLDAFGIDYLLIEAWRETEWPSVRDLGALVVLGGTMNVDQSEVYSFLGPSAELMTQALEEGVLTLGVCLGCQMMARVLGAKVNRATEANATFSSLKLTPEGSNDPVIAPLAGGTPVLQFHEDTFEVPRGAVLLATSESSGLSQAFRYGDLAYAVQFHFEATKSVIEGWCRSIGPETLRADWKTSEEELAAQANLFLADQKAAGKTLLRRFLEIGGYSGRLS